MTRFQRGLLTGFLAVLLAACGGGGGGDNTPPVSSPAPAPTPTPPPTSGAWTALAPMPEAMAEFAIAAHNNRIYVIGGWENRADLWIYDIAGNSWRRGPDLPQGSDHALAEVLNGKIYVFGGTAGTAVQIFDTINETWSHGTNMPTSRLAFATAQLDGKIHLIGGWSEDLHRDLGLHEVYEPATNTWGPTLRAPLVQPRNHVAHGVIGGKIYVVGGRTNNELVTGGVNTSYGEVYEPSLDAWNSIPLLPSPRSGTASAVLGGQLYVFGGEFPWPQIYRTVERYDPSTQLWQRLGDMPIYASGHGAVTVGNSIYVMGGFSGVNGLRNSNARNTETYRYTP